MKTLEILNLDKELKNHPDLNIPLYRIIPFKRLIEIFETKELTIAPADSWEDVYENFLTKAKFNYNSIKIGSSGFGEMIYGICWSLNRETDAMWRIYSTDKSSVKIKTSLLKLKNSVDSYINEYDNKINFCSIGKVRYKSLKNIIKYYNDLPSGAIQSRFLSYVVKSQFIKRKEFKHESELRLIFAIYLSSKNGFPKFKKIPIEPSEFIDDIVFDPRLNISDYELYKKILARYGIKNNISRSKLYKFEGLVIE